MWSKIKANILFLGFIGTTKKILIKILKLNMTNAKEYLAENSGDVYKVNNLEDLILKFDSTSIQYFPEAIEWYENWEKNNRLINLDNKLWNAGKGLQLLLFCIIRNYKPSLVVETGSSHGASASAIAEALRRNKRGTLLTFDIVDADLVLLSDDLRSFVEFRKIKSRRDIKNQITDFRLGSKTDGLQIFLHDSNHSYDYQMMEYKLAKELGFDVLVSDDVDTSAAFFRLKFFPKLILHDSHKYIGILNLNSYEL